MATITVDTGNDIVANDGVTSLREALTIAQGTVEADTIVFDAAVTSASLNSQLIIVSGEDLTIVGDTENDGLANVSIDGLSSTRHFTVEAGARLALEALTMTGGYTFAGTGAAGTSGIDGINGIDGSTGAYGTSDTGGNGTDGTSGTDGTNGADGTNEAGSIINFGQLDLERTIFEMNFAFGGEGGAGGDGGYAGDGGNGGNGGYHGYGTQNPGGAGGYGGYGGDGGSGGDAGNGGSGAGAIFNAASATLSIVDTAFLNNTGNGNRGGYGGVGRDGGAGGNGGNGGDGGFYFGAGPGGNGGDGGDGGNGGDGGSSGYGGEAAGAVLNAGTLTTGTGAQVFGGNSASPGFPTYAAGQQGFLGPGGAYGSGGAGDPAGTVGIAGVDGMEGAYGATGNIGTASNNLLNTGAGTGSVAEADTVYFVYTPDAAADEGNGGPSSFTFNINRIGDDSEAADVFWQVIPVSPDLTAADFSGGVFPSGIASFAAFGPSSMMVSFDFEGDSTIEQNEMFQIELTGLNDPGGGPVQALGTSLTGPLEITNDDPLFSYYSDPTLATLTFELTDPMATLQDAFDDALDDESIVVEDPVLIGNAGPTTVGQNNLTLFANGPLTADLTLDPTINDFALNGDAVIDVTGNGLDNVIVGNSAANDIIGAGGGDTLVGGGGADILTGNTGQDILTGGTGDDTLNGGVDFDTALYEDATGDVAVYLEFTGIDVGGGLGVDTLINIENLTGGDFNDRLIGDAGNNVLTGGDGGDILKGKNGNDTFNGGDGDDRMTGGTGVDIMNGGAGEDIMFALAGDDILNGGDDRDFVYGGRDADTVHGDGGNDEVRGNLGNDMIFGDAGIDDLRGGGNNDTLDGGADGDFLFGENGQDILIGGAGGDSLTGGLGGGAGGDGFQDTFVYSDALSGGGGFDRIKDWENGIDLIDLTAFGFANFAAVDALATDIGGSDVRINFGGGDVLYIENFSTADFDASDVLL